jgi:hypothetical protein
MQGKVDNALVQQPLVASSVLPANFEILLKSIFFNTYIVGVLVVSYDLLLLT